MGLAPSSSISKMSTPRLREGKRDKTFLKNSISYFGMLSNHYYLGISCSEACSVWERAKLQAPRGQHNQSLNSCTIYCERQFILTSHRDRSNFVGGPWRAALSVLLASIWPQILKQHPHMASNAHGPLLGRGLQVLLSPLLQRFMNCDQSQAG